MEDVNNYGDVLMAAPFVAKTYMMVNEPGTDAVIAWGRDNNSLVVVDPFGFSQTLLPAHFKHNNFSSFVRQLNTYGFRKVDSDRWEFAHTSFLRGQTHLLQNIIRRSTTNAGKKKDDEEEECERAVAELMRLKQAQRATEAEVERMWQRVAEAEMKPKQMLGFFVRLMRGPSRAPADVGGGEETFLCDDHKRARRRIEYGGVEEGGRSELGVGLLEATGKPPSPFYDYIDVADHFIIPPEVDFSAGGSGSPPGLG